MRSLALLLASTMLLAGCIEQGTVPAGADDADVAAAFAALTWQEQAPTPFLVGEVAVASDEHRIYVVGGWTQVGGGSPLVQVYDAEADAWTLAPSYPLTVHHAQAAVVDGTLYVFGGAFGMAPVPLDPLAPTGPLTWSRTPLAFKLTPGAEAWEPVAPMPEARSMGGAAVVDGKVYLVGGVGLSGYATAVHVYDPATDSYAQAPPLPTARDHPTVLALDGRVYVLAGRSNAAGAWDDLETVEALDVAAGSWLHLADAPLGRGGQGGAVVDGRIWLVGGERLEGEFTVYDAAHAYDPALDAWLELPRLPQARHGMGVASWADRLYVMGGATLEGVITTSVVSLGPADAEPADAGATKAK